jgi:hypothetical protein
MTRYNRNVKFTWMALAGAVLLLAGCNRGLESTEAVRQGIIDHLATRSGLDVGSMQIDVTSVNFRKDEADATVSFRPKGGGGGAPMQMNYTLERKDNRWVVKTRRDSGANPHGGMPGQQPGAMPQGHPPVPPPEPSGTKQ